MPASVLNLSGPRVSASTAVMTCERTRASSARLRRCSTSAFASGLVNARSGRWKANGSLLPGSTVVAPAVANAIYNAVGVRVRHMPITAEAVLAGLKKGVIVIGSF